MSARHLARERASGPEVANPDARQEVAVGYVRVSREEQAREGVSLEAQRARIIAYAEAKDLQLAAVYADEGKSGKDLDRPGLQEMLARCTSGEVKHIVVWRLDRLTRRTRHLLTLSRICSSPITSRCTRSARASIPRLPTGGLC